MSRLSPLAFAFVLVTLGLAVLGVVTPAAHAAIPPEGTWDWSPAYVPAAGPHAFRAIVAGPGFSLYTAGDDLSGQWIVNGVDCGADGEGSTEWTDTRTGADGGSVSFLATDKYKNLYAAGTDTTSGGDIHVVKYLPDGTVKWQKSWDGPAHLGDTPKAVAVTAAGAVFVAGTIGMPVGYDDAVLLKYDTTGHLKWKYVLSTALYDSFDAVAFDSRGNAYVTGQRNGTVGSATMTTIKVDPYGHQVWQRQISGLGISYSGDFIQVKGTSVYVGGTLYKRATWTVAAKYTTAGKRLWSRADSGPVDTVDAMAVDASGRMIFVGTFDTWSGGDHLTTAWVDMYPSDGAGLPLSGTCVADYGATRYPVVFHAVSLDADGNMYLAGEWCSDSSATEGNALVARIAAPGPATTSLEMEKIWRWDGPASGLDQFWGVLVQPGNGIFAAGTEHAGDLTWKGVVQRLDP